VEQYLVSFDHGTHLLVALVLVAVAAVVVGPGPAASGLVVAGGASVAATVSPVGPVPVALLTGLQLGVYLVAGAAIIGLAWLAVRSRSAAGLAPAVACASLRGPGASPPPMVEPLTDRELEVLRLAASGIPVSEIGERLSLSPNTVKTHLTHAYGKLGVRGRSDAIRAALHHGCLTPADICPHRYRPD
jgi:DNA-binding CsgD family transcriptional regulator